MDETSLMAEFRKVTKKAKAEREFGKPEDGEKTDDGESDVEEGREKRGEKSCGFYFKTTC